jgi:hypothetical protein
MTIQVFGEESRANYVLLSDTLDLTQVSLDDAREGVSVAGAIGGQLLVGTETGMTSFEITPELEWQERSSISFADYPTFSNVYFLNEQTSYLTYDLTKRVVWDPTSLEIKGTMEDSQLALERDGFQLFQAAGNRSSQVFAGPVLQPFHYHDEDWFNFAQDTQIVPYDPETHAELAPIDAPCPSLTFQSQDEAGNTYFSDYGYNPTLALYGEGPAPCVVRIRPDLTLDDAFTTDMRQWTEGRYSTDFRYLRDGLGIASVLHHEELDADFTTGYDVAVDDEVYVGDVWRVWLFDLDAGTARPIDGIEAGPHWGWNYAQLDGRTFVFLDKIYELDLESASVKASIDVPGTIYEWVRLR